MYCGKNGKAKSKRYSKSKRYANPNGSKESKKSLHVQRIGDETLREYNSPTSPQHLEQMKRYAELMGNHKNQGIKSLQGNTLDILEAKELLDTQNVHEENRVAVMGAAQWNDIFNITGFISRDYIPSGSPLTSGSLPTTIAGFMPKMTNVVSTTSYWFHPSFLTLAVQQELNISMYDLGVDGQRATRINCDVLYGIKQLSDVRVVSIA